MNYTCPIHQINLKKEEGSGGYGKDVAIYNCPAKKCHSHIKVKDKNIYSFEFKFEDSKEKLISDQSKLIYLNKDDFYQLPANPCKEFTMEEMSRIRDRAVTLLTFI